MKQRKNLNIPKIIGHRGVKDLAPENTLESIIEAFRIGLKWVEVEVLMDICKLGERPPLGEVPDKMHAFVVRQDRFGEPKDAWQREIISVPAIGPKDVLIYTMATGINYIGKYHGWA